MGIRGRAARFHPLVFVVGVTGVIGALAGCELVAGLQRRVLTQADGGEEAPPLLGLANCTLETSGNGLVRFGHLVPTGDHYDVCMKPATASSFAEVRPVFAGAGAKCRDGLTYKTVTTSIPMPAGQYDVKIVRAGASSCEGDAVATLGATLVSEGEPTSLYILGSGRDAPTVRRFAESRPDRPQQSKVRLIHAVPDLGPLDFGIVSVPKLPAVLGGTYLTKVSFGELPSAQSGGTSADANGYASQQTGATRLNYGVAPTGTTDVSLLRTRSVQSGGAFTFFVSGDPRSPDFPLELFACDEQKGTGVVASCSDGPPVDISISVLNVQLSGPFAGGEADRRPYVVDQVGKLATDLVCITEAYQDKDKDALIAATKGKLPYSYYAKTDETSKADDARDLNGVEQTPSATASCANATTKMNALVDCLQANCATESSPNGVAAQDPSPCMAGKCLPQIFEMIGGTDAEKACWPCVFAQFNSYETMASIRDRCSTNPRGNMGFRGQNGVLILSRFPLKETAFSVMPYVGAWQKGIAKAQVSVDNGATFDFYCGSPSSAAVDCRLFPTLGIYASGATTCQDAIVNQQLLLLKQMRAWAEKTSGASRTPFVLAGDFLSGPSYKDVLEGVNPQNFATFVDGLSLGTPIGYEPTCTGCSDNPLSGVGSTAKGSWTLFNLLKYMPVTNVRSMEVFLKEPAVDTVVGTTPVKVPISFHYPIRTVLRVAP